MDDPTALMLDQAYMQEALKEAKAAFAADEVPVGAVIVHEGKVIARAHNQVEMLKDPTAHAEMIALTQAANTLQEKWLYGAVLYVTLEPCAMCMGAVILARLERVVFGAPDPKTGACGSVFNIAQDRRLNHQVALTSGVMQDQCAYLLSEFFAGKRKKSGPGPGPACA